MSERDLNLHYQDASSSRKVLSDADFEFDRLWSKQDSMDKTLTQAAVEQAIVLGAEAESDGKLEQAISYYQQALDKLPESFQARQDLTTAIMKLRRQNRDEIVTLENKEPSRPPSQNASQANSSFNLSHSRTVSRASNDSSLELEADFTNIGLTHNPSQNSSSIELVSSPSNQFALQANRETSLVSSAKISAAELYVSQAVVYFDKQHWSDSIAACQEALRANPNAGSAYKIWGNCLQRLERFAEAIGLYAKALENNANAAEIYCNLGSIYAKQKKWHKAIENYQKSSNIEPQNHVTYRNLAKVWDELKEYEKSAQCFFKAIALKPDLLSASNHFALANNLIAEGNTERAILCYKSCIDLEPSFLNAYARLADALEQDSRSEEALFYYKKLAQLQTGEDPSEAIPKSLQQISSLLRPVKARPALAPAREQQKMLSLGGSQSKPLLQLQPTSQEVKVARVKTTSKTAQQMQAASIHIKNADLCVSNQQWQPAVAHYRQAIKLAPQQASYHLKLGRTWEKVGDRQKANLAFFTGFGFSPQKIAPGDHYLLGDQLLQQKETEKAIVCYRRAVSIQPKLIEAYWRLGEIAIAGGNYKAALSYYRRALKIDPNRVQSYVLLGKALSQQGNWQGAFTYFQKAASFEPHNADICCYQGEALIKLQRYDEAERLLRQAIEIAPQHAKAYYQLGNFYSQLEQWLPAVEAYEKSIDFGTDSPLAKAYYDLGQAHLELQQWGAAASAFSQAVKLSPASSWTHYGLGSALSELQQWQAASEALEKSLELNPDFDWAYHKLGNAKYEVEDWDGAVDAYRRALAITPGLPKTEDKLNDALRNRSMSDLKGVTHYYQNSLEKQPEDESVYFKALEVSPQDPKIYAKLAGFYRSQGNLKQASAFYKILLQIQPDNLEASIALEEIQSQA